MLAGLLLGMKMTEEGVNILNLVNNIKVSMVIRFYIILCLALNTFFYFFSVSFFSQLTKFSWNLELRDCLGGDSNFR